jgi:CMP-N,N'-diacetyllegionaminic acid synthase
MPRKNLRLLAGRPLIAWTIECARAASGVDRVVVSTDDAEIADVARAWGAEVPFLRPAELARDDTPDRPVFDHAIAALAASGYRPEVVAWLRPTAPLRMEADVDAAVALLAGTGADSVRSVCAVEHHPFWMRRLDDDRLWPFLPDVREEDFPRRQLLPPAYRLNGAVDAVRVARVGATGALFGGDVRGYVMPRERSIDIDDETDLVMAEALLAGRGR